VPFWRVFMCVLEFVGTRRAKRAPLKSPPDYRLGCVSLLPMSIFVESMLAVLVLVQAPTAPSLPDAVIDDFDDSGRGVGNCCSSFSGKNICTLSRPKVSLVIYFIH